MEDLLLLGLGLLGLGLLLLPLGLTLTEAAEFSVWSIASDIGNSTVGIPVPLRGGLFNETDPGVAVVLVQNAFAEGPNLALGDLVLADFDGSTPINRGAGRWDLSRDPLTGDFLNVLEVPAGGWRWETTGSTNLPQTIFGYAVTDNAGVILIATHRFPAGQEIPLTAVGQEIVVAEVKARLRYGSI